MNRRKRTIGIALLLLLLLLVGGCGLWVRGQQMQYALNRQLIEALVKNDGKQALALVNEGADPNTPYKPMPLLSLPELVRQLYHHSPPPTNDSPTAFLIVCGAYSNTEHDEAAFNEAQYDRSEDAPLAQAMLTHGANVNARSPSLHGYWTALMWAVYTHRRNTVGVLLEYRADVNTKDTLGRTPLLLAAQVKSTDVVRQLLEHKADVNARDSSGLTPLMYVEGNPDIVALLRHAGAKK